jgi:protein SCO1/2
MTKRRLIRTAVIAIAGIGLAALIAMSQIQSAPVTGKPLTPVAGSSVGGPFTLIDQTGKTVTEKDFAGQYLLIYFGFTYCPAICPTELQKMNQALKQLGPAANRVQPLFITIDPERDTQPVMKDYVAQFNPRLVGLTGSREQINHVLKAYRVYARRVDDPAANEYTMDHSSYIYFMNPDGQLLGIYGTDSTPADIAADLHRALGS